MRHFDVQNVREAAKVAFKRRPGDVYTYALRTNGKSTSYGRTIRSLSPWMLIEIPVAFTLGGSADVMERANATMSFYNFLNEKYKVFNNLEPNTVQKYAIAMMSLHAEVADIKKRIKAYDYKDDESLLVGNILRKCLGVQNDTALNGILDLPNITKRINKLIDSINKFPLPSGFGIIDKYLYLMSSFFKEDNYKRSTLFWFTPQNMYEWDVSTESATAGMLLPKKGWIAAGDEGTAPTNGISVVPVPAAVEARQDPDIANYLNTKLDRLERIVAAYSVDETISEVARRLNNGVQYGLVLYKQDYLETGTSCDLPAIFDPSLLNELRNAHLYSQIGIGPIDENTLYGYLVQDVKIANSQKMLHYDKESDFDIEDFSEGKNYNVANSMPNILIINSDNPSDLEMSEACENKVMTRTLYASNSGEIEYTNRTAVLDDYKIEVVHSSSLVFGSFFIFSPFKDSTDNGVQWTLSMDRYCNYNVILAADIAQDKTFGSFCKNARTVDFLPLSFTIATSDPFTMAHIIDVVYGDCDNYGTIEASHLSTYFGYLMAAQFTFGY